MTLLAFRPKVMLGILAVCFGLTIWGLALAQVSRDAKLTYAAVSQTVDGDPVTGAVTYNVYQGAKGAANKTKVKTGLTALTSTVTGLPTGETCFNVTAQTVVNGESAFSQEACKSFAVGKPAAVQTLTVE